MKIKQIITKITNWIMAQYATLKAAIEAVIKQNGNQEITGQLLQESLKSIIDSLGANFQLVGFATPQTSPGTPDQNVAYLAGPGTYPNFGPTTVEKGQIGLFKYNGTWSYETIDCGVSIEYEEYPGGDAFEWTFYDSENPDGLTIKIAKNVSGLGNDPNVAISQWWAAQTERKINVLGGYTISIPSLTTSPATLGLFKAIQTGQIIDSITGANKLIFGTDGGGSVTVNASDLPYKATANLVNVRTESGTANNVSIVVRGINDILPAYININEIANHPGAYASAAAALSEVPALYRRKGVKVVYYDDDTQLWIEMLCIDDEGVNWWTDVEINWVIEGPIETEIPTNTGGQQLRVGGTKHGNLDDVLNVNVWNNQATAYATQAAARAAVPANKRKLGAIITYLLSDGWCIEQFIGDNISGWETASNWNLETKTKGIINVSQAYPTGGINGGPTYTMSGAIAKIPTFLRIGGLIITYIDSETLMPVTIQYKSSNIGTFTQRQKWERINPWDFGYFRIPQASSEAYSNGLSVFYIDRKFVKDDTIVAAHCYASKLYVSFNGTDIISAYSFDNITDGEPIILTAEIDGVSTEIGKIIFKDKSLWVANPDGGALVLRNEIITNPNQNGLIDLTRFASKEIIYWGSFDVSDYNKTDNTPHEYASFSAAVSAIPDFAKIGGVSIRFINSTTHKYEQYRLLTPGWSNNVSNWEHIDDKPTLDSSNPVKSGGVKDALNALESFDNALFKTDEGIVWQLNDDNYTGNYGFASIAEYSKIMSSDVVFTTITIRELQASANNTTVQYRIYITDSGVNNPRNVPSRINNGNFAGWQLIQDGTFVAKNIRQNYTLELNKYVVCPRGYQVVILMTTKYTNNAVLNISGANNNTGNVSETSNISYLSTAATPWAGTWGPGNFDPALNKGYFNCALILSFKPLIPTNQTVRNIIDEALVNSVPSMVEDALNPHLDILIPNQIFAVVDTELNLWNDTISLSVDKALHSPLNYNVLWISSKGLITDRGYRFTPTTDDVGLNVSVSCYLYDNTFKVLASKTFVIKVLSKNVLNSQKRIVYFGDSLGSLAATQLYLDFQNPNKFTGVAPLMVGTKNNGTCNYEAVGGWTWASYATQGTIGYRASVSNVTSISLNSVYSDGANNYVVKEVNIVEGSGNILLNRGTGVSTDMIMPTGTLTKISGDGDSTINYANAFRESSNPLWNANTNQLDLDMYKSLLGLQSTDKFDAVSFQFGINDHTLGNNTETLLGYINSLYNLFIADNPNCKFIIGLTTAPGNDVNGSGANYGASNQWVNYINDIYKICKFYLTLQGNANYTNIRIAPIRLELDRYYGYAFSNRQISQRTTTTEKYHNNYVHPGADGYGQMGDAYFASYIGALTE